MSTEQPSPRRSSSCISLLVFLACLGFFAVCLRNTFAAEPGLEAEALRTACSPPAPVGSAGAALDGTASARPARASAPPPCRLQVTREERRPWQRTFGMEDGPVRALVQCRRERWVFGNYQCTKEP